MCDKRRRLNSAMTFDQFVDQNGQEPETPQLKPMVEYMMPIPELDLTCDSPTIDSSRSLLYNDQSTHKQIPKTVKHIKKRMRFQSEHAQYTVINILERQISKMLSFKEECQRSQF